ncbi:hypothetical protein FRC00_006162 [Tulasnella sp. 408]|nr:hypothetical protein FRC00_006162 [Tulasnella sp. 408]
MSIGGWIRRVVAALVGLVKNVSSAVWEAAKVFASGVSHAAQVAVDAAKTLWRWWNTYVPRWIRWALYGTGIMFIVYLILGFGMPGVVAGSAAAGIHAGIGNVAAGSGFAFMQSIGATGLLLKVMLAFGAAVGAALMTEDYSSGRGSLDQIKRVAIKPSTLVK